MTDNLSKIRALGGRLKRRVRMWIGKKEPPQIPTFLTPILVSSTGRSGTTLLMQLLGSSPQIVFNRAYPFEVRYLSYLLRWSLILDEEWKPSDNWNPGEALKPPGSGRLFGPFPYANISLWPAKGLSSMCFETAWKGFSQVMISSVIENNKEAYSREDNKEVSYPQYYAEKIFPWAFEYLERQTIPFNSIFLVRDPRDVFLSVSAFNQQRGIDRFGRSSGDSDLEYAKRLTGSYKNIHNHKVLSSPTCVVVKYEQLVTDLAGQAQRLSDWLGVKLNAEMVKNQEENFKHHMTSTSPEASVERWRREMSQELNDFFVEQLGEELRYFGYETET